MIIGNIEKSIREEAELAETLDLRLFCGEPCRSGTACDILDGLHGGLLTDDGYCNYCLAELQETDDASIDAVPGSAASPGSTD